jgi:hypothetical protein
MKQARSTAESQRRAIQPSPADVDDVTLSLPCWSRGERSAFDGSVALLSDRLRRDARVLLHGARGALGELIVLNRAERTPHLTRLPVIDHEVPAGGGGVVG